MTASRTPPEQQALVTRVIDYEPPPVAPANVAACPLPSPTALRRRSPRRLIPRPVAPEPAPPRTAIVFADTALRHVLEVVDRRRPLTQLGPLVAPAVTDTVLALTRAPRTAAATLRRVRLRMVDDADPAAAEVFATYTRGRRVHAIAARIEYTAGRWRIVALQVG